MLLSHTTNNRSDDTYCERKGNIFKLLNTYLQESLVLASCDNSSCPVCILIILVLSVDFRQNNIPYDIVE
jgi:hypothetical protein